MKAKENKNKDKKQKEEYTVICKFDNNGESFQKVMEKILINRMKNLDL